MKNHRLEHFRMLFEQTTHPCNLYTVAKHINFAIREVPHLLAEYPDDEMLEFEIRSFMRRCFRNAIRIAMCDKVHSDMDRMYPDELAKLAGFHSYKDGNIVSIFDCVEFVDDNLVGCVYEEDEQ